MLKEKDSATKIFNMSHHIHGVINDA